MGRSISIALQNILAKPTRQIVWTLDIGFPGSPTAFNFATSPVTINAVVYSNDIESIGDVRQSIESPADRVRVAIQNKDRNLSEHIIDNFLMWRSAEAKISRVYQLNKPVIIEIFRGAVQATAWDDLKVQFDIIPDTLTPGQIVCHRNEAPQCPAPFKHPLWCGYSGDALVCDHHLKSTGGCEGLENDHRFLGMEHRSDPDQRVPGEPGNPDDPADEPPIRDLPCPRKDQFVRLRGTGDLSVALKAASVRTGDMIWHPVKRKYVRVRSAEIVPNQPIWKVEAENGAVGYSSFRHPLIVNELDFAGTAVESLEIRAKTLTEIDGVLYRSMLTESTDTGELGDVVRIEIDSDDPADKIYCYGEDPDRLFVCHNTKIFTY